MFESLQNQNANFTENQAVSQQDLLKCHCKQAK